MRARTPTRSAQRCAELRDQLLGEAVDEVVVRRIAGQVHERQHDQAGARRRGAVAGPARRVAFERADEAVADAGQRLDEPRLRRVVAEDGPQPLHDRVDAVLEVDRGAVRPQPLADVLAGDDVARAIEHQREELERLLLQPHGVGAAPHLAQAHVDLDAAELHDRAGTRRGSRVPPSVAEARPVTRGVSVMSLPISPRFTSVSPRGIEARGAWPAVWGHVDAGRRAVIVPRSGSTTSTGCRPQIAPGGAGGGRRGPGAGRRRRPPSSTAAAGRPRRRAPIGLAEGELVLRIHRHPQDGAHVLGEAMVRVAPNTIATVYAAAIAERARRTAYALPDASSGASPPTRWAPAARHQRTTPSAA